jgi:hypothetical protein
MKINYSAIFLVLVLLISCNEQKVSENSIKGSLLKIEDPVMINIDDFINDYDTIRLEVSDEALIDGIFSMQIMNEKFYILNRKSTSVFIFATDGKYIGKNNNQGKGPNEYINIQSMEMDYINNRVIISDSFSRKIFVYDEFGNHEQTISLTFPPKRIIPNGNGYINVYSGARNMYTNPNMENFHLHFLDSSGVFMSSSLAIETKQSIDVASHLSVSLLDNGDMLFFPVLGDSIYGVSGNDVSVKYTLTNNSKYSILTKDDKNNFKYSFGSENHFEKYEENGYLLPWGEVIDLEDFIFLPFSGWNKAIYLFYSKKDDKSMLIVPDEVQGNRAMSEIFMTCPKASQGNKFFISPNSYNLQVLAESLPDGKLKTFISNSDENSNPLIVSYSIKFPTIK